MRKAIGCFAAGIALLYFASWAIAQTQAWWGFPSALVGVLGGMACAVLGVVVYLLRHFDGN